MTVAVSLQSVSKTFTKASVVNDLSFEIKAGEMFGLLEPNGAGKSTTIRMITTLPLHNIQGFKSFVSQSDTLSVTLLFTLLNAE